MPLVLHAFTYAFSDLVTVHVNKDTVMVFISFYFCKKNVIFVFTELK